MRYLFERRIIKSKKITNEISNAKSTVIIIIIITRYITYIYVTSISINTKKPISEHCTLLKLHQRCRSYRSREWPEPEPADGSYFFSVEPNLRADSYETAIILGFTRVRKRRHSTETVATHGTRETLLLSSP